MGGDLYLQRDPISKRLRLRHDNSAFMDAIWRGTRDSVARGIDKCQMEW